jgi:peptidoglycan/LPS O-acetylase OafA/YrhL
MSASPEPTAAKPHALRDGHLDTLRGVACLLLVAYHVIGNDPEHGMRIVDMNGWRIFTELFLHIRMPLFSFLSGYVFSLAIEDRTALRAAIVKKFRRIGIPLVVVTTLFFVCFGVTSHTLTWPSWQIYLLPYEHYWYLQATLLIMTVLLVLGYLARGHLKLLLAILFPIAAAIFIAAPTFDPDLFALGSAFYLLPYFLLGNCLRIFEFDRVIGARRPALLIGLGVVLVGLFALDMARLRGWNGLDFERQSALGLLFGVASCLFLYLWKFRVGWLQLIGGYSYTIYLFHVFFTAGVTRLLLALHPGITDGWIFVLALPVGVLGPTLLHHVVVRYRWPALLLLGIDRRRKPLQAGPALAPQRALS